MITERTESTSYTLNQSELLQVVAKFFGENSNLPCHATAYSYDGSVLSFKTMKFEFFTRKDYERV